MPFGGRLVWGVVRAQCASFRPMTPTRIMKRKKIRSIDVLSPKKIIPITAVPTPPIAVQTM